MRGWMSFVPCRLICDNVVDGLECGEYVLETRKFGFCGVPDFHRVNVRAYHILEMRCHGTTVYLGSIARSTDSFGDVKNDACEPVLVDPDFLVIGHLTKFTLEFPSRQQRPEEIAELHAPWPRQVRHRRWLAGEGSSNSSTCNAPNIGEFLRKIADNSASIERGANVCGHCYS